MRLIFGILFMGLVVNIAQAQPGDPPPAGTQGDELKLMIIGSTLIFATVVAVIVVISNLFRKPGISKS